MAMRGTAGASWTMPAEWARHRRCWMAWPHSPVAFGDRLERAQEIYAEIAQAIRRFEPVTMITRPDQVARVSLACGQGISIMPLAHDDSWARDTGPTFVLGEDAALAGVNWTFNGWGGMQPDHAEDQQMAARIADHLGVPGLNSPLTTEGGAIHVDGVGTALICRPSLLDPNRNPNWNEAQVEAELAKHLGVTNVIWLPNAHLDDETAGHIDNLATFVAPGKVLTLECDDPKDANYDLLQENLAVLQASSDAAGNALEVVTISAPDPGYRDDGRRLTLSYINFYLANDGVVMPGFNDAADGAAFKTLQELFPEREIVQIQVRDLIYGGGGIHCITQQQPWSALDGEV